MSINIQRLWSCMGLATVLFAVAPPAAAAGRWQGCRGTGSRVCAELLKPSSDYFYNHPSCTANTLSCQGKYYDCDPNACPEPGFADRIDTLAMGTRVVGEALRSRSQTYKLVMQSDENLVVYRTADNYAMWDSATNGSCSNRQVVRCNDRWEWPESVVEKPALEVACIGASGDTSAGRGERRAADCSTGLAIRLCSMRASRNVGQA